MTPSMASYGVEFLTTALTNIESKKKCERRDKDGTVQPTGLQGLGSCLIPNSLIYPIANNNGY